MAFIKRVEDFVCEKCGNTNKGNGFTNHCHACLWSKHVDNDPGDRKNLCNGLMEPIAVEKGKDSFKIVHKCVLCKYVHRNTMSMDDNFDAIAAIAKKASDAYAMGK